MRDGTSRCLSCSGHDDETTPRRQTWKRVSVEVRAVLWQRHVRIIVPMEVCIESVGVGGPRPECATGWQEGARVDREQDCSSTKAGRLLEGSAHEAR